MKGESEGGQVGGASCHVKAVHKQPVLKCMMGRGGVKKEWAIVLGRKRRKKGRKRRRSRMRRRWMGRRREKRRWAGLCSQVGSGNRKEVAGNRKEVAAVRRALLEEVATSRRTRKR